MCVSLGHQAGLIQVYRIIDVVLHFVYPITSDRFAMRGGSSMSHVLLTSSALEDYEPSLWYQFVANNAEFEVGHNRSMHANERHRDQDNNTQESTHKVLTWKILKGKNHGSPQTPNQSLYQEEYAWDSKGNDLKFLFLRQQLQQRCNYVSSTLVNYVQLLQKLLNIMIFPRCIYTILIHNMGYLQMWPVVGASENILQICHL